MRSCDQCVAHIYTGSVSDIHDGESLIIQINSIVYHEHDIRDLRASNLCFLNVADDGKCVIVTDCSQKIFISMDWGESFTKLETNFSEVEVAVKVLSYISDNSTVLLWVLGQNNSETQLATLRLKRTHSEYVIAEQKVITLDQHNVSISKHATYTNIVDDGRGNMVFFRSSNYIAIPNNVYYILVDMSTGQGYFGGVLIPVVGNEQLHTAGITSIAVDTKRNLLYLAHNKHISVYKLIYTMHDTLS